MHQINKTVKQIFILVSIVSIGSLGVLLSSCSSSSPTPTVTKPGSWTQAASFSGVGISGAASFVIDGKAYVGGGFDASGKRRQDWWQFDPAKGWSKKTTFPGTARSGAVAFTIGGKGYVGAGSVAQGSYLKDFWEFDPLGNAGSGSWVQVKDFGDPATETGRYGCVGFTVSNRGFVAGGTTTDNGADRVTNDFWEYKPANNTWEQRTSMAFKRVNAFSFTIGNLAYVIGGFDAGKGQVVRAVEQYDPANDSWTQKLALNQKDASGATIVQPSSRESAVAFTIGEFGYIAGGLNGGSLGDTWQYNPTTDTWVQYYSFNTSQLYGGIARDGAVGFAIGNVGYMSTGRNSSLQSIRLDDTLKFDPTGTPPL